MFKILSNAEYAVAKEELQFSIESFNEGVKRGDFEETIILSLNHLEDKLEYIVEMDLPFNEALAELNRLLIILIEMERSNDDEKLNDAKRFKTLATDYMWNFIHKSM